jgi:hypothetical protein
VLVSTANALDARGVHRGPKVFLALDIRQVPLVDELGTAHLAKAFLARADNELAVRAMPQNPKLRMATAVRTTLLSNKHRKIHSSGDVYNLKKS